MNLLKDQRENELQPGSVEEKIFQETPELDTILSDREGPQNKSTFSKIDEPLTSYVGTRKGKKPRISIPVIAVAALLVAVVAYFGIFRNPGNGPSDTDIADRSTTEQSSTLDTQQSPPIKDGEDQTAATSSTDKSVTLLGNIMSTIVGSLPSSSKLLTLFLDDGSFSIEVAGQSADLTKFQNDLKAGLPATAKVSSGSVTGGKTLVSGSFPRAEAKTGGSPIQKDQVLSQMTTISNSVGAQVLEKSAAGNVISGNVSKAMIHFKVSGTVNQCQNVLSEFSKKDWNVQISKVILLPLNQQRANLVLRFSLINPA